jgi:hypothetical protein
MHHASCSYTPSSPALALSLGPRPLPCNWQRMWWYRRQVEVHADSDILHHGARAFEAAPTKFRHSGRRDGGYSATGKVGPWNKRVEACIVHGVFGTPHFYLKFGLGVHHRECLSPFVSGRWVRLPYLLSTWTNIDNILPFGMGYWTYPYTHNPRRYTY